MGAISDGRFKEIGGYGTGKGQVDLAKEMRKATAGQELPEVYWAKQGINAAISIFGALTQSNRLTNAGNTGAGSSEEHRTPEEIEASINNVLSEVGCTSVNQLTEAIITKKESIQGNNETINNFKINIDKNKGSIKTLEAKKQAIPANATDQVADQIVNANADIDLEIEKLKQKIKDDEECILATQKNIKEYEQEVEKLEKADKLIKQLNKELANAKKANGQTYVENNLDEQAKNITQLVGKLKNADSGNRRDRLKEDLFSELENYYKTHKTGDCKRIDDIKKFADTTLTLEKERETK